MRATPSGSVPIPQRGRVGAAEVMSFPLAPPWSPSASPRSRAERGRPAGAHSSRTYPRASRWAARPRRLLRRGPKRGAPDRLGPQSRTGRARSRFAVGGSGRGGPPGVPATTTRDGRAVAASGRAPPPAIGGEGAGWEWINWVREGLRDGSVAVNAGGAWLHNIAGEAYLVTPACVEAFAAGRDLAPATIRNRVVRLGRHRSHASPSGAANLFRAVLADGSRVKGMVFPGELVWDDDPPPRSNARLVGNGR